MIRVTMDTTSFYTILIRKFCVSYENQGITQGNQGITLIFVLHVLTDELSYICRIVQIL